MPILFIFANRLGGAILATRPLDQLIWQHPRCRVTVASGPDSEGVSARMMAPT